MSSLIILQITTLMCFLLSIRIKMYKKNIVGFIVITTIFLSIVISYFASAKSYVDIHYILISILLVFIMIYNTYKSWKTKHYLYKKSLEC